LKYATIATLCVRGGKTLIPVPSMAPTEIPVRTSDVLTNFNRTLFLYSVL